MTEPYALVAYLILYLAAAFVWRSVQVWRQTGSNPIMFGRGGDDAHTFVGRMFALTIGLISAVVIARALDLPLSRYAGSFDWLSSQPVRTTGWTLLVIALVWIVMAQHHMGASWRIGVPDKEFSAQVPALVTHGVFARSRNPIFLGMTVSLAGFFLVLPNALTLLTAVLGIVLMHIQIRIEEPYLSMRFGGAYTDYAAKVRRWL